MPVHGSARSASWSVAQRPSLISVRQSDWAHVCPVEPPLSEAGVQFGRGDGDEAVEVLLEPSRDMGLSRTATSSDDSWKSDAFSESRVLSRVCHSWLSGGRGLFSVEPPEKDF